MEPLLIRLPAMAHPAYPAPPAPEAVLASRLAVTSRILRLADGDAAFAAQIRGMLWAEYGAVGAPLGLTEDGMMVWWGERMDDLPE